MAVLRNGAVVLMALVLMALVAPSASTAVCDCNAPADYDCFSDCEAQRQAEVQSMSIASDGSMETTAFPPKGWTITVDSKGKGNFRTIQAAINSVPDGNTRRVTIRILDGVYRYYSIGSYFHGWVATGFKGGNMTMTV